MVLQQLAQLKQSTSAQARLSASTVITLRSLGGFFSSLERNKRNLLLLCLTFCLKERRLTNCILKLSVVDFIIQF
jgi:hypothetical protein